MKRSFRLLCAIGLVAAFLLMATAMVLPHAHDADTHHHVCWICQAKAIGVSAPEPGPQMGFLGQAVMAAVSAEPFGFYRSPGHLFHARAPPSFSPALS